MRRCLLVERVGENGSSIGVPDSKIWVKMRRGAKWGPESEKGEKGTKWERKGARCVLRWGLVRHHHARRVMITRESPPPRQTDLSSHESPPYIPPNPSRPSECPFGPQKDWHANRDELRSSRRRARKPRKSERAKIESFVLCPTFLVPRNAKQRRGNYHNLIFTHGIFSGVGMQNETARTKPAWSDRGSPHQITPRKRFRTRFPKFD